MSLIARLASGGSAEAVLAGAAFGLWAHRHDNEGVGMARERSITPSARSWAQVTADHSSPERALGLTRAEAHALQRSTPLTPAQFKELRHLAEQGVNPLRRI